MRLASGEGGGGTLYQDKVASQEQQDRAQRSWLSCLTRGASSLGSKLAGEVEAAPEEAPPKGPRYDELVQLLSDFRGEYDVLRGQLETVEEAKRAEAEAEEARRQREEELLDERISALEDLKEFVRENQACLREYLGLGQTDDFGAERQTEAYEADEDGYVDPVVAGQRVVAQSESRDAAFAREWEEETRAAQEQAITTELVEHEEQRQQALADYRRRLQEGRVSAEDGQALLGEVQGKLGSIDALLEEEGAKQSRLLSEALERRRKRRTALQDTVGTLAEKQQAHSDKFSRKLKVIKGQEQEALKQVELDVQQEQAEAVAEIERKIADEKERRVNKLQTELQEFNRRNAGLQGELAFSDKLADYKGRVADLDSAMEREAAKQKAELEERMRKRRAARIKKAEEEAKARELNVIADMQERGESLAQGLEDAQAALSPVAEEEKRLAELAEELAPVVAPVVRTRSQRAEAEAARDDFDEELDIIDLEEELKQQEEEGEKAVQAVQGELGQALGRTAEAAAETEARRKELRRRMEQAGDEGERRRLMGQLDSLEKDWEQRLAAENELQAKKLKASLEERRRKRKKAQAELTTRKEEKLVEGAGQALEAIIDDAQDGAEARGHALIEKINAEFSPHEQIQATEGYLDRAHQAELRDLMTAMFAERSKVLKKLVFDMMTQKQAEYEQVAAEFEP